MRTNCEQNYIIISSRTFAAYSSGIYVGFMEGMIPQFKLNTEHVRRAVAKQLITKKAI